MKVLIVLGTRPEIIRLSLVIKRLDKLGIKTVLVHTGQNYDPKLSDIFFKELGIRKPDYHLAIKEKTVGAQIGKIISLTEEVMIKERPDCLLVLGDTNSSLCVITAARLRIPILHMEAGNRAHDWRIPEEKNRKIIDHISDWLFPYTERSKENLIKEGFPAEYIFVSGNPITEVLNYYDKDIEKSDVLEKLHLTTEKYFLATMHREENVDDPLMLKNIVDGFNLIVEKYKLPLIWSIHPRTMSKLDAGKFKLNPLVKENDPFGFFDFTKLEKNALCVLTDSGTVSEECSLYGVPTVAVRQTTERPESVESGSNILSGTTDPTQMLLAVDVMLESRGKWTSPYVGDTNVSDKMVQFIIHRKPVKTK